MSFFVVNMVYPNGRHCYFISVDKCGRWGIEERDGSYFVSCILELFFDYMRC